MSVGSYDWNAHWSIYGTTVRDNPANQYRRRLIESLLPDDHDGLRILDIGSGQGELALHLAHRRPHAEIRGLEMSMTGVDRSRAAAARLGVNASFYQVDLLSGQPYEALEDDWATAAVCSEVLEHVDRPEELLGNACSFMAPGCSVIITVPGGPRTAFDRHIGHLRHFDTESIRAVIERSGLRVRLIQRSGFPFFNLYKSVVLLRGRSLIADDPSATDVAPSKAMNIAYRFFEEAFRFNRPSNRFGWQIVAVAEVPY